MDGLVMCLGDEHAFSFLRFCLLLDVLDVLLLLTSCAWMQ